MIGIVSYGNYIPRYRVSIGEIAAAWHKDPAEIAQALGLRQKSVPHTDEDTVTIAYEAAQAAFSACSLQPSQLDAILVGSESHPYAVNPTATIVGEYLGVSRNYFASDLEFACKAGTAGVILLAGLVQSKAIALGCAIGADTAQSKPHDVLEYASAAAGAALLIGNDSHSVVASLEAWTSYSSDTPDFWRRDGIKYPSHAGRFTGEPAYFAHVSGAFNRLITDFTIEVSSVTHVVFHMPNGKFPRQIAKRLGISSAQIATGLTVDHIGNPYSASSLLGLCRVLDHAKPGETILLISYGSGAGSDALFFRVQEGIAKVQQQRQTKGITVDDYLSHTIPVSYLTYLQLTHKI